MTPQPRLAIAEVAPDAYRAMLGLEACLQAGPLPAALRELVRLRASQLNGCAYCTELHSRGARELGLAGEKLFGVAVWRAAPYFSEAERAALALTDAVTRLGEQGVPDAVWRQAALHFDEPELAALLMTIVTINAWNRIAVATGLAPAPLG